ncbi:MAG: hypothetical protein HWQ41_12170 [Nostoc sp. NOS(2021)]|uniref:hypothetical protein n=1 Tax=Nostoc sp. NOS(2021) TaxID=2815407 RepID=UPI0025F37F4D|nr:hypothetical protein [Nostoc sp. NOS(2021)]MBN3895983.1 hypothetical protein [Nostoc sp. NOS(2021)]
MRKSPAALGVTAALTKSLAQHSPSDAQLTFHGIWKTSLLFLSPKRRETLNFPPSRIEKGVRGLGFSWVFPDDLNCQRRSIAAIFTLQPPYQQVETP